MTLVIDALARISRQCRFEAPTSWVTATDDEAVSVRDDFMREAIDNIAARVDLPAPVGKQTTITGDDSESYALPANFLRMQRDPMAVYESTTTRRAGVPVMSDGAWTHLNNIGTSGAFRYYKIEGYDGNYTISLYANPSSSVSLTVSYVSNVWMATSGGTEGTAFTDDTDVLLYPRRAVELGAIWRFRRDKGLPYEDVLAESEMEIQRLIFDGRQRKVIEFGESGRDYKPMRVPVPDFIPSS